MDYSKFGFCKWAKGNSILTKLLLAGIPMKSESPHQCMCCDLRLLILGDLCPGVFLTRGDVGFIITEVFFLMFPSCQSRLNTY